MEIFTETLVGNVFPIEKLNTDMSNKFKLFSNVQISEQTEVLYLIDCTFGVEEHCLQVSL